MNFVVNGHHSFGDIFFKINWKSEIKCSTNEVPNETFVEFQLMKTKFPLELFPTERKKELNKINDKNSNAKNKHYKIKTCSSVPVIWNISLCRKNLLVVLCSMWDLIPWPVIEPALLSALKVRSSTWPPGKSQCLSIFI